MKKKILGFFTISLLAILNVSAQETFKVMFYNLLNYPSENSLHNFSDRLPVTITLETDATLLNINDANEAYAFSLKKIINNYELTTYIDLYQLLNKSLVVYNNLGQKMKILYTSSDYEQQFNISDLSNGLYYLGVENQNIKPLKFVISN